MSIQLPKSSTQYSAEILAALLATGIKNTSPGSKARALADIIASKFGELETRLFVAASQNLLPYASDDALDTIGDIYGVSRIQAQDASAQATDENFTFYVTTGTFGDINNGQDIVLPAGTRIFTESDSGPVYTLDAQSTLSANLSSASVNASALSTGSSGNAPAGVFTRHNFVNYTQSSFGSLLVINNFGIIGGRDTEDDNSYRYRILLKFQKTGGSSEIDIRAAVLLIPGIQDVTLKPLAGTFLLYVYGISPVVPISLLTTVQAAINSVAAYPNTGLAIAPDLIGISLSITIHLKSGLTTVDQQSVLSSANQAIANYVNNLAIGQELVINQIANLILASDTRILDIGQPDKPIDEIFIWRSKQDGTRYSRFLVGNYVPATGERIVVENIDNAIELTIS